MDPKLLDLIYDLRTQLGSEGAYEVISAYRSQQTNDMLQRRSSNVAKKVSACWAKPLTFD